MMEQNNLINPKYPGIWFGGDYSPEQWDVETQREDVRLMKLSHFKIATIGMFAWSRIEPAEGQFDFGWLDESIARLTAADRRLILGTPSAAPPAWLSANYPETLRTGVDRVRKQHGNRVNYNLGSEVYRAKTQELARRLAERYGQHPNLLAWHLSNEYGGEDFGEESTCQFRLWLRNKFRGDLDALNRAYWTAFWSHAYGSWDEIEPPGGPYGERSIHGLTVDWKRFVTDQTIQFMLNEAAPLRSLTPQVPITTNMMGTYEGLDYRRFGPHLDFISWDSYPAEVADLCDPETWVTVGFKHDLMRSIKRDHPWMVMEYTPSSANWYVSMPLKRPGVHRFESIHALAHGSDGLLHFQWRQSRGCEEQFHGAVVGHSGGETSRVFKEVQAVGQELGTLDEIAGSLPKAEIALVFDWENRWSLDAANGPVRGDKGYLKTCLEFYRAIQQAGCQADIVGMDDDLSRYRLAIAPMAYSLRPNFVDQIEQFVRSGGAFLTTYLSGWVDENSLVFRGGFLAPLREVLGVWSEELDVIPSGSSNAVCMGSLPGWDLEGSFATDEFCELIHAETAEVLGVFSSDFYAGRPAVTAHRYGRGHALYLAARTEPALHDALIAALLSKVGIKPMLGTSTPRGVIVRSRSTVDKEFLFVLNPTRSRVRVTGPNWGDICVDPMDATILTNKRALQGACD